jgi:hypothetical protein
VQNGRSLLKMGDLNSLELAATKSNQMTKDVLLTKLRKALHKTSVVRFILFNDYLLVAKKRKVSHKRSYLVSCKIYSASLTPYKLLNSQLDSSRW